MNPADAPARLPTGARDVLPAEAAELRDAEDALRRALRLHGYREVRTPTLEYGAAIERAAARGLDEAYRLFDADGSVLVLRPDLTIPAARMIATRMADHPGPIRVFYAGSAFRLPQPGRPRLSEHRQAGAELVGPTGPEADAELIELLCACLRAAGLERFRVAVGSAAVLAAALDAHVADDATRLALRRAAAARDHVAWRSGARGLDPAFAALPATRGGRGVLDAVARDIPATADACARLARTLDLLGDTRAADAVAVDLGIAHDRTYYDGVVIEAYAPGVGAPIARGGRYDALAGRFGAARPAIGFGIELDPMHRALAAAVGPRPVARGAVVAGPDGAAVCAGLRAAGLPAVACADPAAAAALADAEGWRFLVVPGGGGHDVRDRATGRAFASARPEEDLPSLP